MKQNLLVDVLGSQSKSVKCFIELTTDDHLIFISGLYRRTRLFWLSRFRQWGDGGPSFDGEHHPENIVSMISLRLVNSVWPDWAIYWTLGNFSKPLATINLPKSPTLLGNFCKGVKIFNFSSEITFGQL